MDTLPSNTFESCGIKSKGVIKALKIVVK